MDNKTFANNIIGKVGGKENIISVTHCVTRLRFKLKDESKVKKDELEKLNGVLGVVFSSGQVQVIIGATVAKVYSEVIKQIDTNQKVETEVKEKITIRGIAKGALDTLISCFTPAIPAIAGSGMIKVLVVLLSSAGILDSTSTTYSILNTIGDGVFYFLPFFVAYNAAKKMNVDIVLSMILAAILLHPNFLSLGEVGTKVEFIGIGMKIMNYSAQALPVIFAVWLLKYVDKFADKYSPNIIKVFFRPMLSLLIVAPIMLIIIGPASSVLGDGFFSMVTVFNKWGWLAVGLNAVLFPIMVLTGTHNATIPLLVQMFATQGFDSIFLPSGMAANIAEAGAAGAVAFKSKNKALKGTALSASLSALLGITEPALYGVNLRLKKPFIAMLLGSLLGGCYIGFIGLAAPTFVTPSVLSAPIFVGSGVNFLLGLSCLPVTYFITFAITYLIGFKDITDGDQKKIKSPIKGEVIELEKVNDEAFSKKSMGEGFAIIPSEGKVEAPFDCKVVAVFPSKHAIGLVREDGLELLIHVGIDTVNLNGKYFETLVESGNYVKAGQTLIKFDLDVLVREGYDTTTSVVVTNSQSYKKIELKNKDILGENSEVLYVEL